MSRKSGGLVLVLLGLFLLVVRNGSLVVPSALPLSRHHQRMCKPVVRMSEGDDDDDDDDDDDVGSLPEQLQEQIFDAIMKAGGVQVDDGPQGKLFMIGSIESDKEEGEDSFAEEIESFLRNQRASKNNSSDPMLLVKKKILIGGGGKDDGSTSGGEQQKSEALQRVASFDMRPREVREHLDRFVVRQEEAKKVLSVAICDHYNVVRRCLADEREREADYSKPNILIMGQSGSGKTFVVKTLAKLLGVPFVKADATKFTETGIVGEDAEDLVRQLVDQADGDVGLAQYGIIYVDEVDKLCRSESVSSSHGGSGTSVVGSGNRGVQSTFLKVMEETEITVNKMVAAGIPEIMLGGSSSNGPSRISTKHILFIFSGAFTSLDARLQKEKEDKPGIGFLDGDDDNDDAADLESDVKSKKSYLNEATSADFVNAGLEPEFIGRIPVRVAVEPLDVEALEEILRDSESSVLRQYERDFRGYGIELTVDDTFVTAVAERAAEENTGARGLVTVLEQTFRDFKYRLPCTGIDALVCDADTVRDPKSSLERVVAAAAASSGDKDDKEDTGEGKGSAATRGQDAVRRRDIERFRPQLASALGLHPERLAFDPPSVEWLVAQSRQSDLSLRTLCKQHFGLFKKDGNAILDALKAYVKHHDNAKVIPVPVEFFNDRARVLRVWLEEHEDEEKVQHKEEEAEEDEIESLSSSSRQQDAHHQPP